MIRIPKPTFVLFVNYTTVNRVNAREFGINGAVLWLGAVVGKLN
jgi:hypothetical protein